MKTLSTLSKLSAYAATTVLITLTSVGNAIAVSFYSITDLGDFQAYDLNDNGQVIGSRFNNNNNTSSHFLWNNGQLTQLNLSTLNPVSAPTSINNQGQITAYGGVWQNGTTTPIGSFNNIFQSAPYDINDNGVMVGASLDNNNKQRAFKWENGQMTNLGTLGGQESTAYAINNNNQIVGSSNNSIGLYNAFLWQNGQIANLGTLGGVFSLANGINDNGQVIGYSTNADELWRGFIWQNGQMTSLGSLGGASYAYGINNTGLVVGMSTNTNQQQRGFLWNNGQMTDLNSLIDPNSGWEITRANKINNNGQILAYGRKDGVERSFLLNPLAAQPNEPRSVPEPTATLGLLAFAALGVRRWQKSSV